MAEEKKSDRSWVKPVVIGGVVIGGGILSYYIVKDLISSFNQTEEDKDEIIQNIMTELEDRDAYWAEIMQKGYITDDERAMLAAKDDALQWKEMALKNLDTNAWTQFVHNLGVTGLELGVGALIPIAGLVAYQWFQRRLKKYPLQKGVPPPQIDGGYGGNTPPPVHPICPYDGISFANTDSFNYHLIHDHPVTTNVNAINAARNSMVI